MKKITLDFLIRLVHIIGLSIIVPLGIIIYWFKMADRLSNKMIKYAKEME